jgi:serine/threonine protein phosphatase PrpC
MKFSVFQLSRIGGRDKNEDRMGYCYTRESGLFVLADGMGGHPEGEVAAQLALETISKLYQREAKPQIQDPAEFLSDALMAAHRQIIRYATTKGMLDTPRTTLVAAILQGGEATWVHCGDSRLYVVRDAKLLMRTKDHSYLEQQNAGVIKIDHKNRNILFTCLGSPIKPVFDKACITLMQGDKLLLCSDGLWGTLSDDQVVHKLAARGVSQAVPDLVESALRAGGQHCDNVTVVALEWETPDVFESTQDLAGPDSSMEAEFASTIEAGLLDAMNDDMDEAMIERSIAEINEAIRRTSGKKS